MSTLICLFSLGGIMTDYFLSRVKHATLFQVLSILFCVQVIVIVLGLKLGFVEIDLVKVLQDYYMYGNDNSLINVIFELRLPRVLLALCVGMGLTLSGIIMQGIVENPLADPYVLGISSGANLGAAVAIFLGLGTMYGSGVVSIFAFLGSIASSFLVMIIANQSGGKDTAKLLLGGIAIGLICSSVSGFLVYKGNEKESMEALSFWLMGNVGNAHIEDVLILFGVVAVIFAYFLTQIRVLNVMLLGYETAIILGINLTNYVYKYLIVNGILVGLIVYNAGLIGFVGLIIPHITRSFIGSNHQKLLPIAVMVGGIFTVLMDILSRTIARGVEIPLGVMFALVGSPILIYLVIKRSYGFFGE